MVRVWTGRAPRNPSRDGGAVEEVGELLGGLDPVARELERLESGEMAQVLNPLNVVVRERDCVQHEVVLEALDLVDAVVVEVAASEKGDGGGGCRIGGPLGSAPRRRGGR